MLRPFRRLFLRFRLHFRPSACGTSNSVSGILPAHSILSSVLVQGIPSSSNRLFALASPTHMSIDHLFLRILSVIQRRNGAQPALSTLYGRLEFFRCSR